MRVHLFPSRTQKLSSSAPTILGGRLPGKIGNANTSLDRNVGAFFYLRKQGARPPVSCWGTPVCALPPVRLRCTPTPATRSGRFFRHRRRSHRSPSRTQKLSSSATTILGGLPVAVPDTFLDFESLRQLSTAATRSAPFICRRQRSHRSPGKIGNANTRESGEILALFLCLQLSLNR